MAEAASFALLGVYIFMQQKYTPISSCQAQVSPYYLVLSRFAPDPRASTINRKEKPLQSTGVLWTSHFATMLVGAASLEVISGTTKLRNPCTSHPFRLRIIRYSVPFPEIATSLELIFVFQSTFDRGGVTYSYDATGEHYGCTDVASFDGMSQNAYFPTSQNSPRLWAEGGDAGDIHQHPEQADLQSQTCGSGQSYVVSVLFNGHMISQLMVRLRDDYLLGQISGTISTIQGSSHYDLTRSPSVLEAPEACALTLTSEEPYQDPVIPVSHHSTSDVEPMTVIPRSSTPSLMPYTSLSPCQYSTYSELSANLAYMAALSAQHDASQSKGKRSIGIERRRKEKMATKAKEKLYKRVLEIPDAITGTLVSTVEWSGKQPATEGKGIRSSGEKDEETSRVRAPIPLRAGAKPSTASKSLPPKQIPPPCVINGGGGTSSSGTMPGRKLGLACLFCRERKIACGRPSESNPDQTCK